jgi:hypothetical protein
MGWQVKSLRIGLSLMLLLLATQPAAGDRIKPFQAVRFFTLCACETHAGSAEGKPGSRGAKICTTNCKSLQTSMNQVEQ